MPLCFHECAGVGEVCVGVGVGWGVGTYFMSVIFWTPPLHIFFLDEKNWQHLYLEHLYIQETFQSIKCWYPIACTRSSGRELNISRPWNFDPLPNFFLIREMDHIGICNIQSYTYIPLRLRLERNVNILVLFVHFLVLLHWGGGGKWYSMISLFPGRWRFWIFLGCVKRGRD